MKNHVHPIALLMEKGCFPLPTMVGTVRYMCSSGFLLCKIHQKSVDLRKNDVLRNPYLLTCVIFEISGGSGVLFNGEKQTGSTWEYVQLESPLMSLKIFHLGQKHNFQRAYKLSSELINQITTTCQQHN